MSNEMRVTVAQNLINALQGKSIAKNVMVLSKIVEHETT